MPRSTTPPGSATKRAAACCAAATSPRNLPGRPPCCLPCSWDRCPGSRIPPSDPSAGDEGFQRDDVVLRILLGHHRHLHPARVNDKEEQQVDCPMPRVLKLLLFDGTGDGPAERTTLQHLEVRFLVERHRPDALASQPFRIAIAPKDFLRTLLEHLVETGRPPGARTVR